MFSIVSVCQSVHQGESPVTTVDLFKLVHLAPFLWTCSVGQLAFSCVCRERFSLNKVTEFEPTALGVSLFIVVNHTGLLIVFSKR